MDTFMKPNQVLAGSKRFLAVLVGGVGFPAVFLIDSGERVVVGHFGIVDAEGVDSADPMIHQGVGVAALDAAGGVFVADEQEHHAFHFAAHGDRCEG